MYGEIVLCNFTRIGRTFSPAFLMWCYLELVIGCITLFLALVISCKPPFEKLVTQCGMGFGWPIPQLPSKFDFFHI